jgi:hypothetical protein
MNVGQNNNRAEGTASGGSGLARGHYFLGMSAGAHRIPFLDPFIDPGYEDPDFTSDPDGDNDEDVGLTSFEQDDEGEDGEEEGDDDLADE